MSEGDEKQTISIHVRAGLPRRRVSHKAITLALAGLFASRFAGSRKPRLAKEIDFGLSGNANKRSFLRAVADHVGNPGRGVYVAEINTSMLESLAEKRWEIL